MGAELATTTQDVGIPVAAVDIGTNSARLLIVTAGPDGVEQIDRQLRLVRLGEGVDQTGRLAVAAIERTVAAVAEFASLWLAAGVGAVRITTTSAARDAANAPDLIEAVHEVTGVRLEVITGEEEGRLAFLGATAGLDGDEPVAILDIGGGSTEMIVGRREPDAWTSRQLGSVRLTERVLVTDPASPAQIDRARAVIAAELDGIAAEAPPPVGSRLIAVAGTATTVAAVHLGADVYPEGQIHGLSMTVEEVEAVTSRLLASNRSEIAGLGAVQAGREDVIAAGALILHETMLRFGFSSVTVSEADSLDGSATELLEAAGTGDLREGGQSTGEDELRAASSAGELVEVVEPDGTVVEVITRAEMRRRGARHRCTYIAVVRSTGHVVVHQRAAWKDVSPSTWDIAFGGVCDVGEGWLVSAIRELQEEAGVSDVSLTDLGQINFEGEGVALVGRVFVALFDGPVTPNDGEVVALAEVPIEKLAGWMSSRPMIEDSPVVVPPLLEAWWRSAPASDS